MEIPNDFPRFQVPGYERQMASLRALYWLHYPGASPKSTLWDEWLPSAGLWPHVATNEMAVQMRRQWAQVLSSRFIDEEGYVATHQHPSIAHQHGWPFPFWNQGRGGFGWHFSFKETVDAGWRPRDLSTTIGWQVEGAADEGINEDGWQLKLNTPNASIITPSQTIDTFQSPFLQLRWKASGLTGAQPCVEWATKQHPDFSSERRFYFDPIDGMERFHYTMIPVYKHPAWTGEIIRLRIRFGNSAPGASVIVQAFFTQYDTRHNVNGQVFIQGCTTYFWWTHDLSFLRRNIHRMRLALRYLMTEHRGLEQKVICTDWVGHDGRTGVIVGADGSKQILSGRGIGNNYWDLLPFGAKDVYATIRYYDVLKRMAALEREIASHPEWGIPGGVWRFKPEELLKHAAEVKREGNRLFWNPQTKRFAPIDSEGRRHDYGYTFLNLEAVYYDFATPAHAKAVMEWVNGDRLVPGDTSQGADIYHWRFGPRATTKRNLQYYVWAWSGPETIPWGGQVQDGGAVLGFAYHDLMARLKVLGADNAWERLQETIRWFDEVQAAGGYRKYYDGSREGTLQGGGTAGGLGMDQEFFESVLLPQVMLDGFLGFVPTGDGFALNPRLPTAWSSLTIDRIHLHNWVLTVRVDRESMEVWKEGEADEACFIRLPAGEWRVYYLDSSGKAVRVEQAKRRKADGAIRLDWHDAAGVKLKK